MGQKGSNGDKPCQTYPGIDKLCHWLRTAKTTFWGRKRTIGDTGCYSRTKMGFDSLRERLLREYPGPSRCLIGWGRTRLGPDRTTKYNWEKLSDPPKGNPCRLTGRPSSRSSADTTASC